MANPKILIHMDSHKIVVFFTKKTRTLGPVKILIVVQTSCFFKTFVKAKYVSWSNQNYLQVYAISAVCFQSSKKRQRENGPECVKWTAWFVLALILLSGGRERFLHVIIKKALLFNSKYLVNDNIRRNRQHQSGICW